MSRVKRPQLLPKWTATKARKAGVVKIDANGGNGSLLPSLRDAMWDSM